MSEINLSSRAQAVLSWIKACNTSKVVLRQASLAAVLGCSRWTIGRALKCLKEAGLIVELSKRHESRCKIYSLVSVLPKNQGLTPQAELQLKLYRGTFESVFSEWPDWEKYYSPTTWKLKNVTNVHDLWRQTFDSLYATRASANCPKRLQP